MDTEIGSLSTRELGGFLIAKRVLIDTAEAEWLDLLVEFDRRCGFVIDGHRDSVCWLMDNCSMARSTAKDRLRVAYELQRRPLLKEALAEGKISYAKIKVLTRIRDMGDDCDRALLVVAAVGTVADTERLYQHYKLLRQQDQPPGDTSKWERCGMETVSRSNGIATIEVRVPVEDEQRFMQLVDSQVRSDTKDPVDKAPVEPAERLTWTQRRALAMLDLIDAGLAHLQAGTDVDIDQAVVNVMCEYDVLVEKAHGTAELDGGFPISGETACRLACDAGLVRIITRGASEVLDIGRKSRHWNRAQRRAIRFRWRGRCAFPGCGHRITQIHHCDPWGNDGETNLDCGVPVCRYHHNLVHEGGWTVSYNPTQRAAIFTSPNNHVVTAPTPGVLTWAA